MEKRQWTTQHKSSFFVVLLLFLLFLYDYVCVFFATRYNWTDLVWIMQTIGYELFTCSHTLKHEHYGHGQVKLDDFHRLVCAHWTEHTVSISKKCIQIHTVCECECIHAHLWRYFAVEWSNEAVSTSFRRSIKMPTFAAVAAAFHYLLFFVLVFVIVFVLFEVRSLPHKHICIILLHKKSSAAFLP